MPRGRRGVTDPEPRPARAPESPGSASISLGDADRGGVAGLAADRNSERIITGRQAGWHDNIHLYESHETGSQPGESYRGVRRSDGGAGLRGRRNQGTVIGGYRSIGNRRADGTGAAQVSDYRTARLGGVARIVESEIGILHHCVAGTQSEEPGRGSKNRDRYGVARAAIDVDGDRSGS